MRDLDIAAAEAAKDHNKMNELIMQYQPFILKCASHTAQKHITTSDDEWSIALTAFCEAVRNYNFEKGGFLSFSEMVINRRLADYFKRNKKYYHEISVNPDVFESDMDEEDNVSVYLTVQEKLSYQHDVSIKDEIEAINKVFYSYGFSFFDLADCSPKAEKTKKHCALAAAYICKNPILLHEIKKTKQLPIKIIEKNAGVPRKILERHRKYIIAAVEILSGEYPCLAEYMQPIRKELNK
ncbi:RNA polymerase sigma factor [Hydrogenoanaerobacterium saccharovorans]|uniref:RNA polymerase sigma factor SigI n=1 Tax=Hydrogenoanaerobacterium saccharovorans TaxID=474960 RepID=A0A1H8DFQ1_9FIRM|nr:RNA polymerase sigma-I factor [Hydrogenoanaerobacterium saccharovorans]RPF42181.1 RNA polymerase sigma factor [Hydrogenoanaerobacterium saccharovorans]SEN05955.1 RNA polymerase sigma factor [Hydrogenoanaerobacterium saccharovorans]